jgi:hypothetical protein
MELCNKVITPMELIAVAKRDNGFKTGEWPAHFDPTRATNRHDAARRAPNLHSFNSGNSYRELRDYLESPAILDGQCAPRPLTASDALSRSAIQIPCVTPTNTEGGRQV